MGKIWMKLRDGPPKWIFTKTTMVALHITKSTVEWWNTYLSNARIQIIYVSWIEFVRLFKERYLSHQFYLEM